MLVTLNGKETELADGMTVTELLKSKKLPPETVVVEQNMEIIPTDAFGTTTINDGDHLEVLRFVGGG
ncbi:sulfur carrier protein ThiS [Maridesulfovibrio sp.]|uniref:sulfur carrier protein ThiS n=1 Tax=Maridesulfovibrio sp. TaxID=2795000 RepID=UPI002A18D906|nr:sulfur carrier protein ThiS [Maridesulfovibrio sp.]